MVFMFADLLSRWQRVRLECATAGEDRSPTRLEPRACHRGRAEFPPHQQAELPASAALPYRPPLVEQRQRLFETVTSLCLASPALISRKMLSTISWACFDQLEPTMTIQPDAKSSAQR
eukprot:4648645-Amphidinium_carterae.1